MRSEGLVRTGILHCYVDMETLQGGQLQTEYYPLSLSKPTLDLKPSKPYVLLVEFKTSRDIAKHGQ